MQAKSDVEAANVLLQAAEASFPKQKRVLAAKMFKNAMVAHKRRWKVRQEEGEGESGFFLLSLHYSFLSFSTVELWKNVVLSKQLAVISEYIVL